MKDAGRIGFLIRGAYLASETYDFLDIVYYNGNSYVAKKQTTGNTPVDNDDNWQIFATGQDGANSYNTLNDKPRINGVELTGDVSSSDIKVLGATEAAAKVKNKLTFTGALADTYDGSEEKTVNIPTITNNLTTSDANSALSAAQGKTLQDGKLGKTEKAADSTKWNAYSLVALETKAEYDAIQAKDDHTFYAVLDNESGE